MKMTIRGLQVAQRDNLRRINALKPTGKFGEAIRVGTLAAHRYAVSITHVDTSSLKNAHRIEMKRNILSGPRGIVFIDPNAPGVGRRGGRRRVMAARMKPSAYGVYEHERGGSHAFYARTESEYGGSIARQAMAVMAGSLK